MARAQEHLTLANALHSLYFYIMSLNPEVDEGPLWKGSRAEVAADRGGEVVRRDVR